MSDDGGDKGKGFSGKYGKFPFFTGVFYGTIYRPPQLIVGALRSGGSLGLFGTNVQDQIAYHNWLTYQAARYGIRLAWGLPVDPHIVRRIWDALPEEAHDNTIEWGKFQVGQFTGGMVASRIISKQLMRYFPKKYVAPSVLFLSCYGAMGLMWRDWWDRGPPPPPPTGGSGGGGIMV
jgi:hypothetical protein